MSSRWPAWRADLAARLHRAWRHRGVLATVLRPLSWLVRLITDARRLQHARHPERAYRADVPVVVIGNLYVGGTGKTPLLLALVGALQSLGWHPGVVSRGYGSKAGEQARVGMGSLDAVLFGDEPAAIAQATGAPVAVHPRRARAVAALRTAHPEVDVIVCDDGLQHRALARDLEILVEDERGVGNGLVLPAGPLRESPAIRAAVDAIVVNGTGTARGSSPRLTHMTVRPNGARRLMDGREMALVDLAAAFPRIAAAAGIGQPERFFTSLREAGVSLDATLALPDHFDFARSPFGSIAAEAILLTEKDAVKCRHLDDARLWAVPAAVRLSDPEFFDWLHQRLLDCRPPLPSTPAAHGHPIA